MCVYIQVNACVSAGKLLGVGTELLTQRVSTFVAGVVAGKCQDSEQGS